LSKEGQDLARAGEFQSFDDVGVEFLKQGDDECHWLVQTTKTKIETAFQWNCFLPEGITETKDGRELKVWQINDELVPIANESTTNANIFRQYIHRKCKKTQFLIQQSEIAYNRLFEYLSKGKAKKIFYELTNIGHIDDKVWNLGNVCIINGNIVPADEQINIYNDVYMIQTTDALNITIDKDKMIRAFDGLLPFYPDFPMIIGWCTAQIFYRKLVDNDIKLPLLFLHGGSGSGKSTLAETCLMLHGVMPKAIESRFRVSMATKTSSAARDRLRDMLFSLPLHIDEYHDKDWEEFKAMYDRSGAKKAKFKTEKDTYALGINSGTIISSVKPPLGNETDELVNRCMYIEMSKSTHFINRKTGKDFDEELWDAKKYLSGWIVEVILNYSWEEFFDNYMRLRQESFLGHIYEKESRIDSNFRLVMAGWEFAKGYFKDYKMPENYWLHKYNELIKWCKGRGVSHKFARAVCRAANHIFYKDKFKISEVPCMFEDEEYVMVRFNFNADLWQSLIEMDNRAEKLLNSISMREVEKSIEEDYPKILRSWHKKSGLLNLGVRKKEIDNITNLMRDSEKSGTGAEL
jgi:energy-coupling factor transporter ATP-binding protein EcfA2